MRLSILTLVLSLHALAVAQEPALDPPSESNLGATQLGRDLPARARGPVMRRARRNRWMPIVRAGYRQVRVEGQVATGGTLDALFPVALVGSGWTPARFGPVFGSGVDLAILSEGLGPRTRHVDVSGAVGFALRVGRPRTDRAMLTSLTWRPTLRSSGGEGYDGPTQRVSVARGRLDAGAAFGHFGFSAFIGLARWSGISEREVGLHLGLAW